MSSYGFPDGQEITQWLGQPIDEQTAYPIGAGSKTIGPAVLANFASIVVALKPTGGKVTVTISQTINGGPPGLVLTQQVVVSAGVTLFEAFVLFADQVTVTLQGAVGGTTVDYSVYPANTTTNAQVASGAVDAAARIFEPFPTVTVIPNGVWTQIPLATVDFTTDPGMVATPGVITIVSPGIYQVNFAALWNTQPTIYAQAAVYRNGLSIPSLAQVGAQVAGTNGSSPGYSDLISCSAGDVLSPRVYQQAGGQTGGGFMSAAKVATL